MSEEESTRSTVTAFRNIFQDRFFFKSIDSSVFSFDIELDDLKQQFDESMTAYYKRTMTLMLKTDAKNRTSNKNLSSLKHSTLNIVMKAFVKSLADIDVRKKTIRDFIMIERSLKRLFNLAEDSNRVRKKLNKFMKKERRNRELTFYKKMIRKNMSQKRIEALMTSYETHSISSS